LLEVQLFRWEQIVDGRYGVVLKNC
jgi:hypothetical protein